MSDARHFEPGLFGCGCLRCGGVWLGVTERQCDCPREPPGPPLYITGVDRELGILTVDSKPPVKRLP